LTNKPGQERRLREQLYGRGPEIRVRDTRTGIALRKYSELLKKGAEGD